MKNRNKIELLGIIATEPEIKRFDNGGMIVSFSLPTNEAYTNKAGEKVTSVQWHKIVFRNKLAESAEKYCRKGARILLTGKLTYRTYEDKDGATRYVPEIEVQDYNLFDFPENAQESPASVPLITPIGEGEEDDSLPF